MGSKITLTTLIETNTNVGAIKGDTKLAITILTITSKLEWGLT